MAYLPAWCISARLGLHACVHYILYDTSVGLPMLYLVHARQVHLGVCDTDVLLTYVKDAVNVNRQVTSLTLRWIPEECTMWLPAYYMLG